MTDYNPPDQQLRIRDKLNSNFIVITVVLLVLVVVAGGLAYQTYTTTFTETDEEVVSSWAEQSDLSQQATVVQANPVFELGSTLTNQPVYFTQLSPDINSTHEYTYSASESGQLDVETTAMLVVRSVNNDGDTLWRTSEPLATEQGTLQPGDRLTTETTINVTEAAAEVERVETGLGASVGSPEITIQFDTSVSGTVNDQSVSTSHQDTVVIEPNGETYSVSPSDGVSETYETTTTVETEVSPSPVRSYVPPGVLIVSFILLLGMVSLKATDRLAPTPTERTMLEHAKQRKKFEDWISRGSVPAGALSGTEIPLDSLEDLVDVAIDTGQRVIEDPQRNAFFVLLDERHYLFEPEPMEVTEESASVTDTDSSEEESEGSDATDGETPQSTLD